jgi:tetratricopeptide (TPR) repeat protein
MNCYEVLGIAATASQEEIREAYRRLIRLYHPDRNTSPNAAEKSSRLNEAYSTLNDPVRRADYDAALKAQNPATEQATGSDSPASAPPPPPDVRCQSCRLRNSSLRLTKLYYAFSFLVITRHGWKTGIRCSRCRALDSLKWSCLSLLVGWWGFPWGPIYTIQALFANAPGGTQIKSENAALLRLVAYLLYQDKQYIEAQRALDASLSYEQNYEATQFRNQVLSQLTRHPAKSKKDHWKYVSALPVSVLIALIAFALVRSANAPRGYEARYSPPASVGREPAYKNTTAAVKIASRSRVNELAERLAEVVVARAPVVGSHVVGTSTVREHVLDRSRFDALELYEISSAIRKQLEETSDDPNGFLASSYFNAQIFALSVDTINRVWKRGTYSRAICRNPLARTVASSSILARERPLWQPI